MDQNNFYQNPQGYADPQAGYNQGYDPSYNQGYDMNGANGYVQNAYNQNGYVQSNFAQGNYNPGYDDGLKACPGKEIAGMILGISAGVFGVISLILGIVLASEASRLVNSSLWDLALRAYTLEAELKTKLEGGVYGIILGIMAIPLGIVAMCLRGSVYRIAQKITGKIKIGFVLGLVGLVLGVVGVILSITGMVRMYEYAESLTRTVNSWGTYW